MKQLENSQAYLQGVQETADEFQKAFAKIDRDKNDDSGIFKDVNNGRGNLLTIRPFDSYSESDSIYFAAYSDDSRFFTEPRTAFVKAFVNGKESEDMRVETCMYKNHITDTMAKKLQTPNLVYYYGTVGGFDMGRFTPDDIYIKGDSEYRTSPRRTLYRKEEGYYRFIFNFTEYLPLTKKGIKFLERENLAITFGDFLKMRRRSPELVSEQELAQLLFQIVYTLWIFEKNGIYHNDLHIDNIIIVKNDSDREFLYAYKEQGQYYFVHMKPRYIAKLFDFDRSYDDEKLCYPNIKRGKYYAPCFQGTDSSEDCYSPNRRGYDLLRMLTSAEDKLSRSDITMFFESELNTVMKRFNKLKAARQSNLISAGIKSMNEYVNMMLRNNVEHQWFDSRTDNSLFEKYPKAELYAYDVKDVARYGTEKKTMTRKRRTLRTSSGRRTIRR